MERIALPIFQARISPVLDACRDLMVIDIEDGQEERRMTVSLVEMSCEERCAAIAGRKIDTVICAGISDRMSCHLENRGIHLVSGIAGSIDRIVAAYCQGRLWEERYLMPGKRRPYPPEGT